MSAPGPVVTYRWEGEDWAFELADVVEVLGARVVTPVPGMDPCVLGIVTWRGRTLPVLAPRPLKETHAAPDLKRRLLVLRRPGAFAVPVDEPGRVIDAGMASVVDVPEGSETQVDGLRLLRLDGRLVRVLDPHSLTRSGRALSSSPTGSARREA